MLFVLNSSIKVTSKVILMTHNSFSVIPVTFWKLNLESLKGIQEKPAF